MNKPDRPEIFDKAQGLFKQAADAGGRALKGARDAGEGVWKSATDAPTQEGKRRKVLFLLGGGIAALVAVLFITSRLGGDGAVHQNIDTAQAVSVITTQTTAFQPVISLNGEARPVRDIQVAAPATGVRILQLLVDEGDYVRAGQPMARLDSNLAQAQIRAGQAGVAEAESAAVRARGEYERAESIRDSGALSTEAIEQRRSAAIAADARLAAARAQMQEVNARLGGGYVRAPAAGLVIDRTAEVGRNVDGQILFRIAADNRLEVAAQVAESDILALTEGTRATFSLVDGSTVEATLRRLPASIDSRTRTGEALFALPTGSRVRAGMYLRGDARLPERQVLAVPQSSILYESGQAYVYVIQPAPPQAAAEGETRSPNREEGAAATDNTPRFVVARTDVQLGARDGVNVEILSGLELNQRIVGAGAAFLQNGDRVRLLQEPPTQAAPEGGARQGETPNATRGSDIRGREG